MPSAQARMLSLFDVPLRTTEPIDQDVAKALFVAFAVPLRIHWS